MSQDVAVGNETQSATMYAGLSSESLREIVGYKDKSIGHMESIIESLRSRLASKDKEIERLQLKVDRIKAIISNP